MGMPAVTAGLPVLIAIVSAPVALDRARIVALCKEGMGATEIARAVGCKRKRGNVCKTLTAAGLNGGKLINGLPGSGRM
jgi:hypothetical protein